MQIKENYINQYKQLHHDKPDFGASSSEFLDEISLIIEYLQPRTVLDYGCGKSTLIEVLATRFPEIIFYGYDPAIIGKETLPVKNCDLIINTDVLEHIPEQILPEIISEISSISQNVYFNLHHALAFAILPNGENAHCTVKPPRWYKYLLQPYFKNEILMLPGRHAVVSVALTFPISNKVRDDYLSIIGSNEDIHGNILKNENAINHGIPSQNTQKKEKSSKKNLLKILFNALKGFLFWPYYIYLIYKNLSKKD